MKTIKTYSYMSIAAIALMLAGHATTAHAARGTAEIQATVDDTNRNVKSMQQDLQSVTSSTADVAARMNATEQQLRLLTTLAEDNRHSIAQLQSSIDNLMRVLYQQRGLTPPNGASVSTTPGEMQPTPESIQSPANGITPQPVPTPQITTTQPTVSVNPTATLGVDQHYQAAQESYKKGEYSAALMQFDEHVSKFPTSPHLANAIYWKAHCYFKMEDYPQAVKGYEQLRLNHVSSEKVPFSIYNEAVAYTRLGQTDKAKNLFQQLIREYPEDAATDQARSGLRQLQGLN